MPEWLMPGCRVDILEKEGLYYRATINSIAADNGGVKLLEIEFDGYKEYWAKVSAELIATMRRPEEMRQMPSIPEETLAKLKSMKKGNKVQYTEVIYDIEYNDPITGRMKLVTGGIKEYEELQPSCIKGGAKKSNTMVNTTEKIKQAKRGEKGDKTKSTGEGDKKSSGEAKDDTTSSGKRANNKNLVGKATNQKKLERKCPP